MLRIILLLSLCCTTLFAQTPKTKSAKKKTDSALSDGDDCRFYNKYSAEKRLMKYPFFKAKQILAVSYKLQHGEKTYAGEEKPDLPEGGFHVKNGVLDTTTLIEKRILNAKQIDKLTSLIFNTDYKKESRVHIQELMGCFDPRNALVFVDSSGKVYDYLEICFSCLGSRSDSDKFDIGVPCNRKYELFSNYFKSVGVAYGTLEKN